MPAMAPRELTPPPETAANGALGSPENANAGDSGGDALRCTNGAGGEGPALDEAGLAALRRAVAAWRAGPVAEASARFPPRSERFTTWSGIDVPDLATPVDAPVDH